MLLRMIYGKGSFLTLPDARTLSLPTRNGWEVCFQWPLSEVPRHLWLLLACYPKLVVFSGPLGRPIAFSAVGEWGVI